MLHLPYDYDLHRCNLGVILIPREQFAFCRGLAPYIYDLFNSKLRLVNSQQEHRFPLDPKFGGGLRCRAYSVAFRLFLLFSIKWNRTTGGFVNKRMQKQDKRRFA